MLRILKKKKVNRARYSVAFENVNSRPERKDLIEIDVELLMERGEKSKARKERKC